MKRINWRSFGAAIFASLTMLAAFPYTLGELSTIIPTEWKPRIAVMGLIATLILRFWNSIVPKQTEPKTGV